MNIDQCMDFCDQDDSCKFVELWNKQNGNTGCRKYRSCGKSKNAINIATTYSKDGICPDAFAGTGITIMILTNLKDE